MQIRLGKIQGKLLIDYRQRMAGDGNDPKLSVVRSIFNVMNKSYGCDRFSGSGLGRKQRAVFWV